MFILTLSADTEAGNLARFRLGWNRAQAAPVRARALAGAPAQACTLESAAVSDKLLKRLRSKRNRSSTTKVLQGGARHPSLH